MNKPLIYFRKYGSDTFARIQGIPELSGKTVSLLVDLVSKEITLKESSHGHPVIKLGLYGHIDIEPSLTEWLHKKAAILTKSDDGSWIGSYGE